MNIQVQKQKPSNKVGIQGEMRLIMLSRGAWLYIKGGNQWHTLNLIPSTAANTVARQGRGDLERKIKRVVDPEADGQFTASSNDYLNEAGAIMDPGGKKSGAALPDRPL